MKKFLNIGTLPLFAGAAGLIGFGLQVAIERNAFDEKGLLVIRHPAVVALYIFIALVLGALFLISRKQEDAFAVFPATPGSFIGTTAILLCVIYTCLQAALGATDRLSVLLCIAGLLVLVGFIVDSIRRKKGKLHGAFFYGAVTLFLLFYVLTRQSAWNQLVQPTRIFFPALALTFIMMSTFYRAYLTVGNTQIKQYLFFHCGALLLSMCAIPYDSFLCGTFAIALLLAPIPEIQKPMVLPQPVMLCLGALKKAGYEAYVVGGCVRDSLLGITPSDYDMCTNATPEQIAKVFSRYELVRSGEKHGTIGVVMDGKMYEITTFRTEGGYTDSRHPDWVKFVKNIEADLARRDFTVNAIAYSPDAGYIDPYGGQQDMEDKILRTVGKAEDRFNEDALRILRGVRFAARFGLQTDLSTFVAMEHCVGNVKNLAGERIFQELKGFLPLAKAKDLCSFAPILTQVIPELDPTWDFEQNTPHHAYDVYTHTSYVVEAVPGDLALRFAALLHDIGKPQTYTEDENGRGHFYGHAAVSANMAEEVMLRLKAPTDLRQQVVTLIENHMIDLHPEKKHLKKLLARFGENTLRKIIVLQEADFRSKGVKEEPNPFPQIKAVLNEALEEANCLSIRDLAIDGNDLMAMGITPGPKMGEILEKLLAMVLDETLENEKTALLQAAEKL